MSHALKIVTFDIMATSCIAHHDDATGADTYEWFIEAIESSDVELASREDAAKALTEELDRLGSVIVLEADESSDRIATPDDWFVVEGESQEDQKERALIALSEVPDAIEVEVVVEVDDHDGEQWWALSNGSADFCAWGTRAQAEEYADLLDRRDGRETNLWRAEEASADEVARSAAWGGEYPCIEDEIDALREEVAL